jgi:nuclear transport factor 2 (NTF2) superfamily protein
MTTQVEAPVFPKGKDAWTKGQANALLRLVEDMFHRRDLAALVNGFTADCIFRFSEPPEQRGREALERFFAARFARQRSYRLTKTLKAIEGNVLVNLWEGAWEDSRSGKAMAGRGLETWVMRDGMIAEWDAAFNVWEQGGERRSAIM